MHSQGSEHLFFRHFTEQGCLGDLCILLVTHLLPDRPDFIQVLDRVGRVGAILPKPKSVHGPTLAWAQQHYPVLPLNRHWTSDPGEVIASALLMGVSGTYSWHTISADYLSVWPLLLFPEALLNGMTMTLLAVYRPYWVNTFFDREYLGR